MQASFPRNPELEKKLDELASVVKSSLRGKDLSRPEANSVYAARAATIPVAHDRVGIIERITRFLGLR